MNLILIIYGIFIGLLQLRHYLLIFGCYMYSLTKMYKFGKLGPLLSSSLFLSLLHLLLIDINRIQMVLMNFSNSRKKVHLWRSLNIQPWKSIESLSKKSREKSLRAMKNKKSVKK